MADYKIDASKLPEDVREKLAELDLELSEGNISTWTTRIIDDQLQFSELVNEDDSNIQDVPSVILS